MTEETKQAERLTTTEAAKYLDVTPQTMWNWRDKKKGPVYTQLGGDGGKIYYYIGDLINWEQSQRSDAKAVAQ